MDLFQAVFLGIIQGLGEFLPISSSAHLVLVPWIFDWNDPGLAFDVALHLGTFLATLIYFRKDLIKITKAVLNSSGDNLKRRLFWFLVLASIPGALAGYFLNDLAEATFRQPLLIAFTLAFFGGVLYWADKQARLTKKLEDISIQDAFAIGLAQALAIIPGVSRSGITITAGLFRGINRAVAARFSFLLALPIIFGATLFKMPELIKTGVSVNEIAGILAAFISGYGAIAGLLKLVEKGNYKTFFWYRLILAGIIVLFWLVK